MTKPTCLNTGNRVGEPFALADVSLPDNLALTDASQTLSAWTELIEDLEETPLFPIQSLADILQLLVPLWSNHPEWRELLDLVDVAVGERLGKSALGARARDRAMRLFGQGVVSIHLRNSIGRRSNGGLEKRFADRCSQ